jgi:formylglycine-generating enzyme required for sulfatase activity
VYVSRADAVKFAQWHGMTLPTESQWEKAARGTDGRIYPWGNQWEDGLANSNEYWNKGARGLWSKLRRRDIGTTTPVGYFSPRGDSPYSCADMSGDVWEWCNDWYDEDEYKNRANISVKDPQGPQEERSRILRGGSFYNGHSYARCANRGWVHPVKFDDNLGFRVCVSPILKSEL